VLVLDAGSDGVMCLRGPALHGVQLQNTTPPTVPATYALETLRWTQALISVSARSGAIPASRLSSAEVADLALSADCVVHRPEQLPPALAELTDAKATDYR
ncbi:MAG: hypothetical protein K0V04_20895, partial [Deltaproteobacteria bacterium]|nr:hypothetical protein [Deltaproteobacteria bacterium]